MAYTINLTDGSIFATIADGTINTSSSMILVGKNYAGYGEFLDENFIHLLENGANSVAPSAPLAGQLWWDKAQNVMKVYTGSTFKTISAATASPAQPSSNVTGDLWFDTTNQQLKVWNGTAFVLIGPASTSTEGTSGSIVTTLTDVLSVQHVVVQLFVQDTLVAMVSKDSTFTPAPSISGFATVGPGLQLSTTVPNALFRGTASNADTLDGINGSQFIRNDQNATTSGTLGVLNNNGLSVGVSQSGQLLVDAGNTQVNLRNNTQDANLAVQINRGGTFTEVLKVNGLTSLVSMEQSSGLRLTGPLQVNVGNTATAITNAAGNGIGNIGSASSVFNTIFAKATSAQYADVAERFAADTELEPGTVVELGGDAEITISRDELSDRVFGVISTNAAYLMNAGAGTDKTHPPVAMTGRVPVKVIGKVIKGDRLVSAGNGIARSAVPNEATPFNTIGRALESKNSAGLGTVEAIVTIK